MNIKTPIDKNIKLNNFKNKFDLEILPDELKNNIKDFMNQYLKDKSDLLFDELYCKIKANLNYYEIERIVPKNTTDVIRKEIRCLF